jgi:hypothetical protein
MPQKFNVEYFTAEYFVLLPVNEERTYYTVIVDDAKYIDYCNSIYV